MSNLPTHSSTVVILGARRADVSDRELGTRCHLLDIASGVEDVLCHLVIEDRAAGNTTG
jgi:hypothetical protein